MPPWPGGPCPTCGEDMPERLIHCRSCRTLLNTDLEPDSVEIPEFVPLQEIEPIPELPIRGYYITCPACTRELRIKRDLVGEKVTCKHCHGGFLLDIADGAVALHGVYVRCPKCDERLRMALKYVGVKVACKGCATRLKVLKD